MKENQNKTKIIELRNQGLSYGAIAKMFGLSRSRIHVICSGYHSNKNKKLKLSVIRRDGNKCQWCGKTKKDMVVHHADFNDKNNTIGNLITLCNPCHLRFHRSNHINEKIEEKLNRSTKILTIKNKTNSHGKSKQINHRRPN